MDPSEERLRHPEDWVGCTLHKKWRLDELLGVGGVASVYSATTRQGNKVAVKLMHPHWADEPTVKKRFLREGYAANRVKHPAVVSAQHDGVTDGGLPFLVMELLEGRNLDMEMMVNGLMPVGQVLEIADQVLDAMVAAHAKDILHRDLKPDNLLLLHDGTIRVLDFGIARLQDASSTDPRLTVNGRAMGTPGFMSPEQARGDWDQVDVRTDIWSLGATMMALLTGREAHEGELQQELLVAAMTQPVDPIQSIDDTIPDRVAEIIDRALAFRPEERWGTASEMQRVVRQARALVDPDERSDESPCSLRPVATDPQPSLPRAEPKPTRRSFRTAVALGVAVAAAAVGVYERATIADQVERALAGEVAVVASGLAAIAHRAAASVELPELQEPEVEEPEVEEPEVEEPDEARQATAAITFEVEVSAEDPADGGSVIDLDLPD